MPEFVIEREVPGAGRMSETQVRELAVRSLEAVASLPGVRWLHSYVTDDKLYCVYFAPDPEALREHARRAGTPCHRVSAVRRMMDPTAAT